MARIIFLNGCSSSGKTSAADAIQTISETPWLHIGVDTFIDMLPTRFIDFGDKAKEGFFYLEPGENGYGPTMQVKNGALGDAFFLKTPRAVAYWADAGYDLIVDEVLLEDQQMLDQYVQELAAHTVYYMEITCDLEVAMARERLRADRPQGLVNSQKSMGYQLVGEYDLRVDTTHTPASQVAQKILDFVARTPRPAGFKKREAQLLEKSKKSA